MYTVYRELPLEVAAASHTFFSCIFRLCMEGCRGIWSCVSDPYKDLLGNETAHNLRSILINITKNVNTQHSVVNSVIGELC